MIVYNLADEVTNFIINKLVPIFTILSEDKLKINLLTKNEARISMNFNVIIETLLNIICIKASLVSLLLLILNSSYINKNYIEIYEACKYILNNLLPRLYANSNGLSFFAYISALTFCNFFHHICRHKKYGPVRYISDCDIVKYIFNGDSREYKQQVEATIQNNINTLSLPNSFLRGSYLRSCSPLLQVHLRKSHRDLKELLGKLSSEKHIDLWPANRNTNDRKSLQYMLAFGTIYFGLVTSLSYSLSIGKISELKLDTYFDIVAVIEFCCFVSLVSLVCLTTSPLTVIIVLSIIDMQRYLKVYKKQITDCINNIICIRNDYINGNIENKRKLIDKLRKIDKTILVLYIRLDYFEYQMSLVKLSAEPQLIIMMMFCAIIMIILLITIQIMYINFNSIALSASIVYCFINIYIPLHANMNCKNEDLVSRLFLSLLAEIGAMNELFNTESKLIPLTQTTNKIKNNDLDCNTIDDDDDYEVIIPTSAHKRKALFDPDSLRLCVFNPLIVRLWRRKLSHLEQLKRKLSFNIFDVAVDYRLILRVSTYKHILELTGLNTNKLVYQKIDMLLFKLNFWMISLSSIIIRSFLEV